MAAGEPSTTEADELGEDDDPDGDAEVGDSDVGVGVGVTVAVAVVVAVAVAVVVVVAVAVAVTVVVLVGVGAGLVAEAVGSATLGPGAVGRATLGDWDCRLEMAAEADERMSDALLEIALPAEPPHPAISAVQPIASADATARWRAVMACGRGWRP